MGKGAQIAAAGIAMAISLGLSACDGVAADPPASPSASATSSPSPSATPTPVDPELKAAQDQYKAFYADYIDAARQPPTGKPPSSLLRYADSRGPLTDWLNNAFAQNKKFGTRVVGGEVVVTTGPKIKESSDDDTIVFNACIDSRTLKREEGGKPSSIRTDWEHVQVEMDAAPGSDDTARTSPSAWRVYAFNQITLHRECEY